MGDLTLEHVVLRIAAVLLIAPVSGFTIAVMACAMGDRGPRYDDRLTLNPVGHIDLIGGLLTVFFTVGWIRPIAVDPNKLRPGRLGLVTVVVGASCATIALAWVLRLMRPYALNMLPDTTAATAFVFVETVTQLSVSFTLFNLLPLPLLTAQHLLVAALPHRREAFRRVQPYAAVPLALLIATGAVASLLAPAEAAIARVIFDA